MIYLSLLFVIIVSPIVGCVAQIYVFRKSISRTIAGSVAIGFGVGFVVLGIGCLICGDFWSLSRLIAALVTYCCTGYTYFHINNMGETSRRVRLAVELLRHPGGMSYSQITNLYNSDTQVTRRLERLILSGDIVDQDGKFYLNRLRYLLVYYICNCFKFMIIGKSTDSI